jgi:hypothetical protein
MLPSSQLFPFTLIYHIRFTPNGTSLRCHHRNFSSISHFAPNYIIVLPLLLITTFHRFHISHRTTSLHRHRWSPLIFIGLSLRTILHHRIAIAAHRYFSSVSHFTPNYIIAIAAHS